MNAVPFFALAAVLAAMAHWGGVRVDRLVGHGDAAQQEHRIRVVRRGARACWAFAAVFMVFAAVTLVTSPGG